jgi:hypothetical protein
MGLLVRAVNTAADSENKIHDDRVAAAYGFRGGLVPGVTVYGYLAAAVMEHFGPAWLERGAMDVRFHQPVYEGEEVVVTIRPEGGRVRVEAGECASGMAWIEPGPPPKAADYAERPLDERPPASRESLAAGLVLGTLVQRLDLSESQVTAPLDPAIGLDRIAHPAVLLALANEILARNVILGPWIHAASEIRKFSVAKDGQEIRVRGKIESCYERKGHEFVVLNVMILAENHRPIEHVRHTAIWRPRTTR